MSAALLDPGLATARASADHGDWAAADREVRELLAAHPNSAQGLYLLAEIQFHENKPKDSLGTFTLAAKAAPPVAADFRFVALDYVLLNDFDDAERWITRAVHDNPADGENWYAMGRIKYTQNRFGEAVTSFQKALDRMPRSIRAENNLGLAYEGLNQPDNAMAAYRQALAWEAGAAHPSEQPLLNLGILLTDRNQLDTALPLLRQAESLAPTDSKIHGALGKLYARRNELPLAQGELEAAVTGDPGNSGLHFQLGQIYRKQGMTARATAELDRAAALEREGRR